MSQQKKGNGVSTIDECMPTRHVASQDEVEETWV